ncbi:hypothetical protein BC1002_4138 [Paraburkholderia atlantica]|uniref:Uncharacterized protein n=2 Tax=Paraburkholderia atlantica TaxID=2654982 RepID=D5WI41_PARAM|nr:hypothetical protein BC1002_4138 [Paraburkholderia atlantica]
MLSSNACGRLCSQTTIGRGDSARSLEAPPEHGSWPLRLRSDVSQHVETSGSNLRRVAQRAECLADTPAEVLMLNGSRSRDRQAELFNLALREAERVWLDERVYQRPCMLKNSLSESLDTALRRLANRVPASDARVIGLDAPDQDCQNLFSAAVLIATIVACGGFVICAVDPRRKRAKVLKFALTSCGLRLKQITLDDWLRKYMVDGSEIGVRKSPEMERKVPVTNQAVSWASRPRVRLLLDYLEPQVRNIASKHIDVWVDAPVSDIKSSITSRLKKKKYAETRADCGERMGGTGVQGHDVARATDREAAQRAACAAAYRNDFALGRRAKERRRR